MGAAILPRSKMPAFNPSEQSRAARLGFWIRWGLVTVCLLNVCYRLAQRPGCDAITARQLHSITPEAGSASLSSHSSSSSQADQSESCAVRVEDISSWAHSGLNEPPFEFPKIVWQTVEDKKNVSCESLECMRTWMEMNPGYDHRLVDAKERHEFVSTYYPEVLKVYEALSTNVERADLWRYLALHKYGGVYADSDVRCLQPIDTWNAVNGHDADLLVGVVFTDKQEMVTRVNNFIIAAMPCHPVMAAMPFTVMSRITNTALHGGSVRFEKGKALMNGVVGRTGPVALTGTIQEYAQRHRAPWPVNASEGVVGDQGNLVGRVRLMPRNVMTMGWETAESKITCDEAQKLHPSAYICHQYFGTWKSDYKHRPSLTYTDSCTYEGLKQQYVTQQ